MKLQLLCLLLPLAAACDSSAPPAPVAVPESLRVGPHEFHRRELESGLRAVAVRDDAETASVFLVVGVGKRQETAATTGLAHLVEHALFTGTPTTGTDEHERLVRSWGGESNAFTREDYTLYYDHELPPERLATVLAMEADRLRNLTFERAAVEHERHRLEVEEAHTFQPAQRRHERVDASCFRVHPYRYGVQDEEGHTAARGLSVEVVKAFYDRHYHPRNVCVVVVTPGDPDGALDEIESAFSGLAAGQAPDSVPSSPGSTRASCASPRPSRATATSPLGSCPSAGTRPARIWSCSPPGSTSAARTASPSSRPHRPTAWTATSFASPRWERGPPQ